MKNLYFASLFLVLTAFSFVEDCGFNLHLKMDKRLLELKSENSSSDTIILYRHWTGTNGERGYSRIIKKENGIYHRKDLLFTNQSSKLTESEWIVLNLTDNPITHFTSIDPQKSDSLKKPEIQMSHDGLHTVQVFSNNKLIYCDQIWELEVLENDGVSRIDFIKTLRDLSEFRPMILGTKRKN